MTEKHDPQWDKEMKPWLTADEVHKYLASKHRMYVSVDIANWIADGFQKAFDLGYQLRDSRLKIRKLGKSEERNRISERVRNEEHEDITNIIECACQLEGALYRSTNNPKDKEEFGKELFNLRKALEGVFGNDIPCNGY